ncbi:Carbon monoxide dehydrogenase large chain [archaeon HR01]|nr:Carbon monoxide dehydrogenase large chain [archaeon HR01]
MLTGQPVKRINDRKFITGGGTYTSDIWFPGMLHVVFVRSRMPHSRIKDVVLPARYEGRGVYLYTFEDVGELGELDVEAADEYSKPVYQRVLCDGEANFYLEPLAAVVAQSRWEALDAAEAVEVDYEPLPAVTDPEKALEPDSALVHQHLGSNIYYHQTFSSGDVESAFRKAYKVVRVRQRIQRIAPVALETRAVVAKYDSGNDFLTVWSTTQNPHRLRSFLASHLQRRESTIRVIAPDVGGGFGSKLSIYPEELLIPYLAIKHSRPVAWHEARSENFTNTSHGRDMVGYIEAAVDSRGKILGIKARVIADIGAYPYGFTREMAQLAVQMITGCYDIRDVEAEVFSAYTNKAPISPYRGAGRPEASYFIERTVERIAKTLQMDPAEVRLRNFIAGSQFPYSTAIGYTYDTGDYERALKKVLEVADYRSLREEQKRMRERGVLMGIGFSSYVEVCTFAEQPASVRVAPDGSVTVYSGTSPHGQGDETAFAQIVSDILGVPLDRITILHSDTSLGLPGQGTAGSWTLASGGNAILSACKKVLEKMRQIAAHLLEVRYEDIEYGDGNFYVKDDPSRRMGFKDVASAAYSVGRLPPEISPGLEASDFYVPELTFPFGSYIAVVEVDPETGYVRVRKAFMVDDCGRIVNPLLVDGQIVGGAVQALGQALYEELVYGEDGTLITSNLSDYLIPSSTEAPVFILEKTTTPATNPLGAKGVGEASTVGFTQAVVNAIEDAVGVEIDETPVTPYRLWKAIRRNKHL